MPRLAVARKDQIETIYGESHALWGGGLTFQEYRQFWEELSSTEWARKYVTYYVWLDEQDQVLSSFKLYRPLVKLLERTTRACIIGAVFTPRAHRRHGHAVEMIRTALEQARERGEGLALLFSDIGTRFYATLGFRPLPAEEVWGKLGRVPPAAPDDLELRPMRPGDLEPVRRAHHEWCLGQQLAILRDLDHWRFLLARTAGFFARLKDAGLTHRLRVAIRGGEFQGYLITVDGHAEWSVREVGAVGGDPRTMADILRLGAAEARRAGLRRIYGWLPRQLTDQLPELNLRRSARTRATPMVLALDGGDLAALESPWAAFLPYQDQF